MKKITLFLLGIVISISLISQTPQAFKYQAVVRNDQGEVINNQTVSFRISIHDDTPGGTVVFQETHTVPTDAYGHASLEIGKGTMVTGLVSDIDWSTNDKYLEVELDPLGNTAYVSMGTTQLLAVPYSLYAESTGDTSRWRRNMDDLYYLDGKVGIGTSNPQVLLDVKSSSEEIGSSIYLSNSDDSHWLQLYGGRGGVSPIDPTIFWQEGQALRFASFGTQVNELMRISDIGNVGIRTPSPLVDLDIRSAGPDLSSRILLGNSDNSSNVFLNSGTDTENPFISHRGGDALLFGRYDGGFIEFMRLQSDGFVGIGTTSPTQMLEVSDTIYSSSGGFKFPDGSVQETAAGNGGIISIDDLTDARTLGYSVYMGEGSGIADDGSDNNNTAVGMNAMMSNTNGYNNTALGYLALYSNTTGDANTAIGRTALYSNHTGSFNTALGLSASYHNIDGDNNVVVGNGANFRNEGGSENTIIGLQAGFCANLHSKSGNVLIGFHAGYNDTTDNKLFIENSSSSTPLIGGDFELDLVYLNEKVGIGTDSIFSTLHIEDVDLEMTSDAIENDILVIEDSDAGLGLYSNGGGGFGSSINLGEIISGSLSDKWSIFRTTSTTGDASQLRFSYGSSPNYYQNPVRMTIDSGGRVGIGTDVPSAGIHLKGDQFPNTFMYLQSDDLQDAGFRLYEGNTDKWHIFNNASLDGFQIYNDVGQNVFFADQSTANVGIGTTTLLPDAKLQVQADNKIGIYGLVDPTGSSEYVGIRGWASGGIGTNYGFYGTSYNAHYNVGVYGDADGGILFNAGVYGWAYSYGPNHWAGYFNGNVECTGGYTKGFSKTKIDHPLDPENKYLYHGSVESSDLMNIYNGNVILDSNGEAWVILPNWFEAFNGDFRYQLTCIGGFAQIYIAEEVNDNKFKISGGTEGMKVSWQISGIRKDKFAEQNQIIVETDKPMHERGKYLHPSAFGLDDSQRIRNIVPVE